VRLGRISRYFGYRVNLILPKNTSQLFTAIYPTHVVFLVTHSDFHSHTSSSSQLPVFCLMLFFVFLHSFVREKNVLNIFLILLHFSSRTYPKHPSNLLSTVRLGRISRYFGYRFDLILPKTLPNYLQLSTPTHLVLLLTHSDSHTSSSSQLAVFRLILFYFYTILRTSKRGRNNNLDAKRRAWFGSNDVFGVVVEGDDFAASHTYRVLTKKKNYILQLFIFF